MAAETAHIRAMLRRHYDDGDVLLVPLIDSIRTTPSGTAPNDVDIEAAVHIVVARVRQELETMAAQGARTIYSILVRRLRFVALNLGLTQDRNALAQILGVISAQTFRSDGILLSVVVGKAGDWMPSKGFSTIAEELGKLQPGDSFVHFYAKELAAVHSHYST